MPALEFAPPSLLGTHMGCFQVFALMNQVARNTWVQSFCGQVVFLYLGLMPTCGIAGLGGSCILRF
jgi:hypothetical protein